MISIIIPVYNTEQFLHRCIDSVINQNYKDWELLLIDDGSLDNSGKICDEYAMRDYRVKCIHQENEGVSSARNLGLKYAQGEWITFVDSDDFIEKSFLKSFFKYGEEADIIIQGLCKVNVDTGNRSFIGENDGVFEGGDMLPFLLKIQKTWQLGYAGSKLYRKHIIDQLELIFNTKFHQGEDLLFNLQYLGACHRIQNISTNNQYIYNWRKSHYKSQDFIAILFEQYEAMRKIEGAQKHMDELKAIYSHHILFHYIFSPRSPYKKKHKERFLSELYSYRARRPASEYGKKYRLFLAISNLSKNKKYASWLLSVF